MRATCCKSRARIASASRRSVVPVDRFIARPSAPVKRIIHFPFDALDKLPVPFARLLFFRITMRLLMSSPTSPTSLSHPCKGKREVQVVESLYQVNFALPCP